MFRDLTKLNKNCEPELYNFYTLSKYNKKYKLYFCNIIVNFFVGKLNIFQRFMFALLTYTTK